jgi:hypothetical protein
VAGRSALTLLRDSFAGGSCYIFARDENSISCWRSCEEKKGKRRLVCFFCLKVLLAQSVQEISLLMRQLYLVFRKVMGFSTLHLTDKNDQKFLSNLCLV